MQFSFYPGHERGCGHPNDCPHMGGAGVGMLVQLVNTAEDSRMYLHRQLDAERQRSSELVADVLRLEEELKQARLELRLERQNKFATNEQKSEDKVEPASDTGALYGNRKNAERRRVIQVGSVQYQLNTTGWLKFPRHVAALTAEVRSRPRNQLTRLTTCKKTSSTTCIKLSSIGIKPVVAMTVAAGSSRLARTRFSTVGSVRSCDPERSGCET